VRERQPQGAAVHGRQGEQVDEGVAVAPVVDELHGGGAPGLDGGAQLAARGRLRRRVARAALEEAAVAPEHRGRGVPRDAREPGVGVDERHVGRARVGDGDPLLDGVHGPLLQAEELELAARDGDQGRH